MAMVSPLFLVILRGYRILMVLYVPVPSLPFLQGFDTIVTTVAVRRQGEVPGFFKALPNAFPFIPITSPLRTLFAF